MFDGDNIITQMQALILISTTILQRKNGIPVHLVVSLMTKNHGILRHQPLSPALPKYMEIIGMQKCTNFESFHDQPVLMTLMAMIKCWIKMAKESCNYFLDCSMRNSTETYGLCIAFYLDKQLSRTSMETITVCIDVRAGHGWPNPPARSIVPFIKTMISMLDAKFPGRLSKSILYPLPFAATAL